MAEIQITINPADLDKLHESLRKMQTATGRDMAIVVRNAARDVTYELIRRTPIARRFQSMKAPGGGYWIHLGHRYLKTPVTFTGTRAQAQKYSDWGTEKPVKGRGYAKASFIPILRRLGVPPPPNQRARTWRKDPAVYEVFVSTLQRILEPGVTMGTTLPYIGKLDAQFDIKAAALRAVARKTADRAQRILDKQAQQFAAKTAFSVAGAIL